MISLRNIPAFELFCKN